MGIYRLETSIVTRMQLHLVVAGLGGCLQRRWNCENSPGRNVPVVGVCDQGIELLVLVMIGFEIQ